MSCRFRRGIAYFQGEPRYLLAGDYPYYRDDVRNWRARLEAQKAAGLDVVSFYIPWRHHGPEDPFRAGGTYDLTGRTQPNRDVVGLLRLAEEVGLHAIVKPGPFVHAELPFGGLPDHVCAERNPEAGIEPVREATGEPRTWRLAGMDAGSVRVLPAPYGKVFDRYAEHWLSSLTRDALVGRFWPEGPIIGVQLMNEGVYSESSSAEPTQFAFSRSSIARYHEYLEARYGSVAAYNEVHGAGIRAWQEVTPPRRAELLSRPRDLLVYLDWSGFQATIYSDLARHYKAIMVRAGMPAQTPVLFNFNPNGSTYRDRPASNDGWYTRVCGPEVDDLVFGSTNWLGVVSNDRQAFRQYVMAITARRGPAMEQNWGFATQYHAPYEFVTPSAFESMLGIACGATGMTAYTFAGARAWRDDPNLAGEWMPERMNGRGDATEGDYPGESPVLSSGERTPKYWTLVQIAQLFSDEGPRFVEGGVRADVAWAVYAPYAWAGQWLPRGDPDDLLWRPPLKAVPRGAFHGLDAFVEMMLRSGVGFRQVDLSSQLDDAPRILCLSSHEYMDAEAQERLAWHVEEGGGLVLTGLVPDRDEWFRPLVGALAERIFPHGPPRVRELHVPRRLRMGESTIGYAMEFAHCIEPPRGATDLVRLDEDVVGYSRRVGRGVAVYLGVGPWRAELSGDDRVVAQEGQAFVWGFVEGVARELGIPLVRPVEADGETIVLDHGQDETRCLFVVVRERVGLVRVDAPGLEGVRVEGASQAVHALVLEQGALVGAYVRGVNDIRVEGVPPVAVAGGSRISADVPCDLVVTRGKGGLRVSVAHSPGRARVFLPVPASRVVEVVDGEGAPAAWWDEEGGTVVVVSDVSTRGVHVVRLASEPPIGRAAERGARAGGPQGPL